MTIKVCACITEYNLYLIKKFQFINVKFRHKASSTEDLKSLFHAEKELVKHLNVAKDDMKNDTALKRTVDDYLQGIDYDL